jgi:amino acid adenylation domain-containing protein
MGPRATELSAAKQALLAKWLRAGPEAELGIRPDRADRPVLSYVQERQLFLELLEPGTAVNNLAIAARLEGPLDLAALERSANQVLARHEVLRTAFDLSQGRAVPRSLPAATIELPLTDLTGDPDPSAAARRLADREAGRPFNLECAPLVRGLVLRQAETVHLLTIVVHHTVADGWSLGILLEELFAHYRAQVTGAADPRPPLGIQYRDFAAWQRSAQHEPRWQEALRYWRDRLQGPLPVLDLPVDHPRLARQTFRGATYRLQLSPALTSDLRSLARRHDATLFMTLVAGLQALLHRYTGQDDVLVGTPIAGRNRPETQDLIGAFINTLALRVTLDDDPAFADLLARVRDVALGAYAHQDLPFERLVAELRPPRDLSRTPVFLVLFILQNSPLPALEAPGLTITLVPVERGATAFDLTVEVREGDGGLALAFEYNADLFEPATIDRLAGAYALLLEAAAEDAGTRVSALPLMREADRHHLVAGLNQTAEACPGIGIHRLIAAQGRRTPGAEALVCGDARLTYDALAQRTARLAAELRARGIAAGDRVGIYLDRTAELLPALLAVLEVGGAYLPLDRALPAERVRGLLADARAALALTDAEAPALPCPSLVLAPAEDPREPPASPVPAGTPDDLAYLIYTSGSTGSPKGVPVIHRAVVNLLSSMARRLALGPNTRLLAVTSISFDIAALELFLPLTVGGTVVLADRASIADRRRLEALLRDEAITHMQATPSRWRALLAGDWRGTPGLTLLSGGEPLTPELADRLAGCGDALWNLYGPTETTIWSSAGLVRQGERPVTVGRPLGNTRFYIVDAHLQPVPLGAVGELCIAGHGVASGYWGLPETTASRFVAAPAGLGPDAGARLFRTGDLARYRPDGSVELLGRRDEQLKLHGIRIEPAEVEAQLRDHPDVGDAAVALREGPRGERHLVAFVVPRGERPPGGSALRRFLGARLPASLVPALFVPLPALPLTPAGKVDRRALPVGPTSAPDRPPATPPRTPLERQLEAIYASVLGLPQVGIHDNYFDLGGGSIQVLEIIVRAEGEGVTLAPEWLFEHQTVAELAGFLEHHG